MTQLKAIQREKNYIVLHFTYNTPAYTISREADVEIVLDRFADVVKIFVHRLDASALMYLAEACKAYHLSLTSLCSEFGFVNPPQPVQEASFQTT